MFGQTAQELQHWNFYFSTAERFALETQLKTANLNYNSSNTVTSNSTVVGGVRPSLGRGDIV